VKLLLLFQVPFLSNLIPWSFFSFISVLELMGEPAQGIKPKRKYTFLVSGLLFHQIIGLKGLPGGCRGEAVLAQRG